ncbi:uncharacterized protein LOC132702357 [Cylas formicarius]|uniref:uncharacterized protein LOC132702357 n=1 Tax=Cylas formicarius TaxID=197179 RepID=UPI0029585EB1|nr:uncharacterized protein LOC132702357 [Cylas formicarius]
MHNGLPVHDSTEEATEDFSTTTNNLEEVIRHEQRPWWFKDGIKDIAFYLRSHKFNEYDRRYQTDAKTAPRANYKSFPKPPLRSLHWEVNKYCDRSFLQCVDYLRKKVRMTSLKREDDSAVVIQEQRWERVKNAEQIGQIEFECKKLRDADDHYARPFEGPLERFQWRTTASYYMCWYTMNEVPDLEHIGERCDNFAYCLDISFGPTNEDPRADDSIPFACALYSFCPDPCCANKHVTSPETCWNSLENNPCYGESPPDQRECTFNRTRNKEFTDIILNRWNVSCKCPKAGYEWSSRYGICVDIDECALEDGNFCTGEGEGCLNLPGSYRCICQWGYVYDDTRNECVVNEAVSVIKLHGTRNVTKAGRKGFRWFMSKVLKLFARSSAGISILDSSQSIYLNLIYFVFVQRCLWRTIV